MKKISILCLTLLSFLFAQSQIRYLKGGLQGSQQTPPVNETGSGVVIVKYNMATKALELFGDYAGLSTPIVGSHIHRGAPGVAGPVAITLANSGDTTGTLAGTATLTQGQEDSLLAGNMYANVHTTKYGDGELRAQLTVTDENSTFFSAKLLGAQETPATASKATGWAYAVVDMVTDSIFITGHYTGLTTASNNAHVHLQDPGTAGGVLFPVYHSFATQGSVHAVTKATPADAAAIAGGHTYVNVHSSTYPNGEIRGQLLNTSGMQYFAGNMSGANEVPAVTTDARGTVIVVYNTETNELKLAGDYQKLSDSVTVAHIHKGAPGVAGPAIIPLTTSGDSTGTIVVVDTLTDEQETDLLAGNLYVNVHSKKNPNGEIRTQLVATTSGESHLFAVKLTTAEVVKPKITTPSTAGGNALILVDKKTGVTYATGAFQGINSNAIQAHIHRGPVGDTAAAILPLTIVQRAPVPHSGTFSGSATLSAALVDSMINGLAYIDVHSSRLTHGAMRAQLGDLVLPIKLISFNAYKQRSEVVLVWETSEEVNVSNYEIQQFNATTKEWVTKGNVAANGNAKYSYNDVPNTYGSPYAIYRLKINDKDGRETYSSIVKLNFEKLKAELFIQTNPVTDGILRYTITGLTTDKKAEVSVIDYNGRLMIRNIVSSLTNNSLKIRNLPAGMYKLAVRVDGNLLHKSFIK